MNQLKCAACAKTYPLNEPVWRCTCGGLLDLEFAAVIDPEKIKSRKPTLWRYREAIPVVKDEHIVSFDEGFTPLQEIRIGGKKLLVKLEQLFTTGSFKDRGASVMISQAKAMGVTHVVEDSSGNAGCAVAAYCAKAGIACDIYVPAGNSPGKLAQITAYGANLKKVPGTRKDTADACFEAAQKTFYASHTWNPFFFQGTKTFAFEVWEQMGFEAPATVILPAGGGTFLIGVYLGFKDLLAQKLISAMPKFIGVQSDQCAPLVRMFNEKLEALPKITAGHTIAEGIAIVDPVRAGQMVDIIRSTGGTFLTVSDAGVKAALKEVWAQGLYIEPTSATVIAAFSKYAPGPGETVVAPLTGHGLKATEKLKDFF